MQTFAAVTDLTLVALILCAIFYRQLRWRRAGWDSLRVPVILGALGLAMTAQQAGLIGALTLSGWGVVAVQLLTGVAFGVVMGRLARIRTGSEGLEFRGGGVGIALWGALIVLRIGESILGQHFGGPRPGELVGLILLMVAMNRLVVALVVDQRQHNQREFTYA